MRKKSVILSFAITSSIVLGELNEAYFVGKDPSSSCTLSMFILCTVILTYTAFDGVVNVFGTPPFVPNPDIYTLFVS
jgi:hypothetical protein